MTVTPLTEGNSSAVKNAVEEPSRNTMSPGAMSVTAARDLFFLRAVLVTAQGKGNMPPACLRDLHAAVTALNQSALLEVFEVAADTGGADVHFAGEVFHRCVLGIAQKGENFVLPFTFVHIVSTFLRGDAHSCMIIIP